MVGEVRQEAAHLDASPDLRMIWLHRGYRDNEVKSKTKTSTYTLVDKQREIARQYVCLTIFEYFK